MGKFYHEIEDLKRSYANFSNERIKENKKNYMDIVDEELDQKHEEKPLPFDPNFSWDDMPTHGDYEIFIFYSDVH